MDIEDKVEEVTNNIKELQKELKHIQDNICPHDKIMYKYGGSTGNYDPNDDRYWVDIKCLDCKRQSTHYSDDDDGMYSGFKKTMGKVVCASKKECDVVGIPYE